MVKVAILNHLAGRQVDEQVDEYVVGAWCIEYGVDEVLLGTNKDGGDL